MISRVRVATAATSCLLALLVAILLVRTSYSRFRLPELPPVPRPTVDARLAAPLFPPHPTLSSSEQARLNSTESSFIASVLRSECHQALSSGDTLAIQSPLSINHVWIFAGDPRAPLLYQQRSSLANTDSSLSDAIHDFADRNGTETDIRKLGTIPVRHRIVSETTANRLFRAPHQKSHPFIICLSRPGFDRNLTVGIIYLGVTTPGFHYGNINIFRKHEGKWCKTNQTLLPGGCF